MGSPYPQAEEVREALVEPEAAAAAGRATWGEELGRGQQGDRTSSSASPTGFHQPSAVQLDQRQVWDGGARAAPAGQPPGNGAERGAERH